MPHKIGLKDLPKLVEKGMVALKENPKYQDVKTAATIQSLAQEIFNIQTEVFRDFTEDQKNSIINKSAAIDKTCDKVISDINKKAKVIRNEIEGFGAHLAKIEKEAHQHILADSKEASDKSILDLEKASKAIEVNIQEQLNFLKDCGQKIRDGIIKMESGFSIYCDKKKLELEELKNLLSMDIKILDAKTEINQKKIIENLSKDINNLIVNNFWSLVWQAIKGIFTKKK